MPRLVLFVFANLLAAIHGRGGGGGDGGARGSVQHTSTTRGRGGAEEKPNDMTAEDADEKAVAAVLGGTTGSGSDTEDELLRKREERIASAIAKNTDEINHNAEEEKDIFDAADKQRAVQSATSEKDPMTVPPRPPPPAENKALSNLFRKSLINIKAHKHTEPAPPVEDKAKPDWAALEGSEAVRGFAYGLIEELTTTMKGRLPCNALPYILSHFGWLVTYKQKGLLVDIGSNANNHSVSRSLAATFPERDVLAVASAGSPSGSGVRLPENVRLHSTPGRLTSDMVSEYSEVALAVFSCVDPVCVSAGLSTLQPLLKPGSVVVFSRILGYPSYLEGAVKVLYDTLEGHPSLGFELMGGRFVSDQTGAVCALHNPKGESCAGGIAVRFVPTKETQRLPGGHVVPTTMPVISPLCAGVGTADEQLLKQHNALNISFGVFKSVVESRIMSLALAREEKEKHGAKMSGGLGKIEARLLDLESSVGTLNIAVVVLLAVIVMLLHRVYVVQTRSKAAWLKN